MDEVLGRDDAIDMCQADVSCSHNVLENDVNNYPGAEAPLLLSRIAVGADLGMCSIPVWDAGQILSYVPDQPIEDHPTRACTRRAATSITAGR